MGIENLTAYNSTNSFATSVAKIFGQPCTVYFPSQSRTVGYENRGRILELSTSVPNIATHHTTRQTKILINFHPEKQVYYRYNYFPDNAEELVLAVAFPSDFLRENCIIRTAVPQATSIWGDLWFSLCKVVDQGIYKTLNRQFFMRPVASSELPKLFELGISVKEF